MPDSFGKRQRDAVKARKAAAREERRIARRERRSGGGSVSSFGDFPEGATVEEAADESAPTDPSESEEVVDLSDEATRT